MKTSKHTQKDLTMINSLSNKIILLFVGFMFSFFSIQAMPSNEMNSNTLATTSIYGNSFIFVESNIEFSIFPDGQFDFNILGNSNNLNVSINTGNVSVSFNSGYNYNGYIQYDEYGAIIQIENIPIYYDDYGRVIQAGNVNIFYNNYGRIARVGSLNVFYNNYNQFAYTTGYINIYNRGYIFRPWHRYYRVPRPNYCVVYNRPYRTHYRPVRYRYVRPFINNARPRTAIATRRGAAISRNRSYATAYRSSKNKTSVNKSAYRKSAANKNYSNRRTTKTTRNSSKNVARTQTQRSSKNTTQNYRKSASKNNSVAKNPNNKNTRTYNNKSRKSQQVATKSNNNRSTKRPKTTRVNDNKQRTAQNYSRSSNNNTRSTARRMRS
ncbi:hypothetical protein JJL45_10475 [Tamlana sp. s12]|uniref:hypothetical protein n=1 Tax=Tamlana sp. s12 TaxID=1630406 RepID=UPI0008391918|nr:hypothetical protein [Tamlana sp. s12]QQY81354.1 hypothetical protein JJL45_10475 [Tamlana sp. s12]